MVKISIRAIIYAASLLIVPFGLLAQGAPPATPIDGGLSLLLVAGGAYGLKKVMSIKPKK